MRCPKCKHDFDPPRVEVEHLVIDGLEELRKALNTHTNAAGAGPSGITEVAPHEWSPRCASGECGKCRRSK